MPTVYSKNPDIVFRRIAGECVLVPIKNKLGDMESIYTLNETAAAAWELIDGCKGMKEIASAIFDEFDVPAERAEADLRELFAQLEAVGAINKSGKR